LQRLKRTSNSPEGSCRLKFKPNSGLSENTRKVSHQKKVIAALRGNNRGCDAFSMEKK
jgi:hypothetical protein